MWPVRSIVNISSRHFFWTTKSIPTTKAAASTAHRQTSSKWWTFSKKCFKMSSKTNQRKGIPRSFQHRCTTSSRLNGETHVWNNACCDIMERCIVIKRYYLRTETSMEGRSRWRRLMILLRIALAISTTKNKKAKRIERAILHIRIYFWIP